MLPIYTTKNLIEYIEKVERQKVVLQLSTIISSNCKKELTETYELQIKIATTELAFIKAKEIKVSFELVGTNSID